MTRRRAFSRPLALVGSLGLLVLLMSACLPVRSPRPSGSPSPASAPGATLGQPSDTPQPTATASPEPQPYPAASGGRPFMGFWNVPREDLDEVAAYGVQVVFYAARGPEDAVAYLRTARAAGLRVVLHLVPARRMRASGCPSREPGGRCPFQVAVFRQALEAYRGAGLEAYADVWLAHMLLDEPFDPDNWGGVPLTYEQLRQARQASREVLGPVPVAVNFGTLPPDPPEGVVDVAMVTFYRNKMRRYGSLEAFLAEQRARAAAMGVEGLVVLLQAMGGARFGPFPEPEAMERQALALCGAPDIMGFFWWTWRKPQVVDLATVVRGPRGPAYRAMFTRVAAACGRR